MAYKVIQWATGGVGRAAIQDILAHPELTLVGCWVSSEAKDGRDVGEIVGSGPIGVTATRDVDTLLGMDADCVLYRPVMADRDLVCRLLASELGFAVDPDPLAQPGHCRNRQPRGQRHPLRVPGRRRHQDLPGPAADRRPRCAAVGFAGQSLNEERPT